MSNTDRDRPATSGNPWLSVLLILVGCVLLLPGVCAIIMIGVDWKSVNYLVVAICFAVSIGGILLIREGIRRWRR